METQLTGLAPEEIKGIHPHSFSFGFRRFKKWFPLPAALAAVASLNNP